MSSNILKALKYAGEMAVSKVLDVPGPEFDPQYHGGGERRKKEGRRRGKRRNGRREGK